MSSFVYYFSLLMGGIYFFLGLLLLVTEFYPFLSINVPFKPFLGAIMLAYGAFRIIRIIKQNKNEESI